MAATVCVLRGAFCGGRTSPEASVERGFVFRLEREPIDSIFERSDPPVIARYFPGSESETQQA